MCSDPTGEITIATLILIGSAVAGAASAGYTAYTTYQAGWDTADILWYTFGAGLGGFLTVYTLGMSAYQVYLNYCMLNGITPVSDISFSSNNVAATPAQVSYTELHTSGTSRPDKLSSPPANGSYVQYDNKGNIYSYTQFDERGRQSLRVDFQGKPHAETLPHIHLYKYLEKGGRKEYTFDLSWHLLDD